MILRYYGNCHFLKWDFGISFKISSVFGILNLSRCDENVNFTKGNWGFEEKIDGISVCSTYYITDFYKGQGQLSP